MKKFLSLAILLSAGVSAHAAITVQHLWSFDGNLNDSVGTLGLAFGSSPATLQSATTPGRATDGYVNFPGISASSGLKQAATTTETFAANDYGVEFWVRITDPSSTASQALFLANNNPNALSITYNDGTSTGFTVSANGVAYVLTNLGRLTDTQWHRFAAVRDGGNMRAFLDGVEYSYAGNTGNATRATNTSALDLFVGSNASTSDSRMYKGDMDEVRYFTFAAGAFNANTDLYQVPEPSTYALGMLAIGLGASLFLRRRQKAAK